MPEQEESKMVNNRKWYVMIHRKPQWIETMLEKESRGELLTREQMDADYQPEPFEYYVPYLYMRPNASDELRSIFHSFVFINASEGRIQEIVRSDWNTKTQYCLSHYRNRSGKSITISDMEYNQLRDIIYNSQLKVFFSVPVLPVRKMQVGNRVLLKLKNWENHPGVIESIRLKKDSVSIRVAFNFLGQTKSVSFDDLHDGDVTFADSVTEQLITGDLIQNFEKEVSILLGHRFKKHKNETVNGEGLVVNDQCSMVNVQCSTVNEKDLSRLRRLLTYADIQIDDEDDRKRFTSLMLICAALLGDKEACEKIKLQILQWLEESDSASLCEKTKKLQLSISNLQFIEAYMLLAFFVYTRDPRLRSAVKAYRKEHPDCPPILGTFINKVRDIQTTKRGHKA